MGSLPICKIVLKAKKPCHKPYPKVLISCGDYIRKKRLDLNLKQSDVAKIIDVTTDTIINWELNRAEPQVYLIPKIISFLGYTLDLYDNEIKTYRIQRGLSNKEFARILKINTRTLAKIEANKKVREEIIEKINNMILYHY